MQGICCRDNLFTALPLYLYRHCAHGVNQKGVMDNGSIRKRGTFGRHAHFSCVVTHAGKYQILQQSAC